jgi:hypothetical protein
MASESKVEFSGTKKRDKGGNTVPKTAESHDGLYAPGTKNGQDYAISKRIEASTDSTLEDSAVTGAKRREIGPAEAIRRKNNHSRDNRTALGTGKSSDVVIGG